MRSGGRGDRHRCARDRHAATADHEVASRSSTRTRRNIAERGAVLPKGLPHDDGPPRRRPTRALDDRCSSSGGDGAISALDLTSGASRRWARSAGWPTPTAGGRTENSSSSSKGAALVPSTRRDLWSDGAFAIPYRPATTSRSRVAISSGSKRSTAHRFSAPLRSADHVWPPLRWRSM